MRFIGHHLCVNKTFYTMTQQIRFSLLTILIAAAVFFSQPLFAQQNALKITPFQPILGKMTFSYERVVEPKVTLMVEYQRWFEHRQSGVGLFFFGFPASSTASNTNKGYRINFLARKYTKSALNGAFIEGGAYLGKHDITTRTETSILLPDPDFFFLPINQTTVEEKEYKNVRVAGLKAGGGWQKSAGIFTFECSGGLNLNGFNDKNVRPTLGMKPVSPYARLALGVRF